MNDDQRVKGRRLRTFLRRGLLAVFLAGVAVLLVLAFMPKPVAVDTAAVVRGDMQVTVDEDGRTRVKDRYVVSAPLTGSLARLELAPGDSVAQGDVIARIVPAASPLLDARTRIEAEERAAAAGAAERQVRASIERSRIAHDFAARELQRQRDLQSRGAISATAMERAELELRTLGEEMTSLQFGARVAEHQARMAQAALGRFGARAASPEQFDVTAPVEGEVLRVLQESEGLVAAGAPILELGSPAALEIVADVLTSDAVRIQPGAHVEIDRWGGDAVLAAHVRRVEPSAFTRVSALGVEEQRVNVVIDLDTPREGWALLGDGYRVEVRIVVSRATAVLKVPASALFRDGAGYAVYVVTDGKAQRTTVEIGQRNGLEAEVTSGLREGATVIVHPSDRVAQGVSVEPR